MEEHQDLIGQVVAGDTAARQTFYDSYYKLVWHVLNSMGLNGTEAEDLFQDFFVHVLKEDCRCLRLWHGEHLPAYLSRITRHLAIDYLRSRRSSQSVEDLGSPVDREALETARVAPSPEGYALQRELREIVLAGIGELSGRDRTLVRRFYFLDETYEEISAAMDLSVSNVGVSLKRARERLRKRLAEAHRDMFTT